MKQIESERTALIRWQLADARRWAAYCLNVSHPSGHVAWRAARKEVKALEDELEAAIVLDRQDPDDHWDL
jgi:hypothetical protein